MDSILQLTASQTSHYSPAPLAPRLPDSTKGKVSETLQLNTKTPGMDKMFISRCSLQFLQQPVLLLTSRFANLFAIARSPARSQDIGPPHISLLKRIKILLPRTARPVQPVCTEFAGCLAIIQCQLTDMPSLYAWCCHTNC